jgi:hypothetical protein
MSQPLPGELRLRRAVGLEVHEVKDGLIVFDPMSERVHYLNPTASLLFELCDGRHSVAESNAILARLYHLPPDSREADQSLAQLLAEGVLVAAAD